MQIATVVYLHEENVPIETIAQMYQDSIKDIDYEDALASVKIIIDRAEGGRCMHYFISQ